LLTQANFCCACRYEDNFDAVNNVAITATPTDKSDITQLGSPDQFAEKLGFLFGKQAFQGG
jgi:photosystem II oxygen-evolving enhancer protein 2